MEKIENELKKKTRHDKRVAYFKKRHEKGEAYKYVPNPYKKGTLEYEQERIKRAGKNTPHKVPLQLFTSIMTKLDNQLVKKRIAYNKRPAVKTICKKTV